MLNSISLILVAAYRMIGSGFLGGSCRFEPCCSEYAIQSLRQHSFFKAHYLIFRRLLRCRPGGPSGYDPVPDQIKGLT